MNQFQSVGELWAALRRRAALIALVALIGCAISLWVAFNQTKVYETTAVVQIEEGQVPDSLAGPSAQGQDASRRVRLIEQRLMSRDNLLRFMEEHQLFAADPAMTLNERVFQMRKAVQIEEIRAASNSYQPTRDAPSGLLITVTLDDPQKAADLANELMETVIRQSRDRSVDRARDTLAFFEEEAARVEASIEAQELRIAGFKQDNAAALPTGLTALREQLTTLQDNELELDREIVAMEGSPTRQREEVQARQVALLKEQKVLVQNRIAQIEETIRNAPEVERALSGLERELTQLQEQYNVITRRKADAEMGQMLEDRQQMARFEVLETALVPEVPASSSRKKLAAMGAVASLIAGLVAGFVAELANPAIRSAAQMERVLGIQPVVAIPPIRTSRDRRGKGLRRLGLFALLAAALWAGLHFFGSLVPWQGLFGKWLPRAAQG